MRWYVAREERLVRQRAIAALPKYHPSTLDYERARADAKRIETRALRELAKACAQARANMEGVEDGLKRPRLPKSEIVDV